jgi:hypothetical protein
MDQVLIFILGFLAGQYVAIQAVIRLTEPINRRE